MKKSELGKAFKNYWMDADGYDGEITINTRQQTIETDGNVFDYYASDDGTIFYRLHGATSAWRCVTHPGAPTVSVNGTPYIAELTI